MKGTRPLATEEIIAVSNQFNDTYEVRNRNLLILNKTKKIDVTLFEKYVILL